MSWGVRGLRVRYGERVALDGVDLEVEPGVVTAVVGGDGAGKTSLLRVLAGSVRPAAGEVRRPGQDRIGFTSAGSGVYRDLTVEENLAFSASAYGVRGDAFRRAADELLDRTGLAGFRGRLAGQLSGGMRQKLAFATAVLHRPDLLIMDEPTTGVDPVSRAELWRLVADVAADGTAVLFSTTYLDEAERAARVLVLDEGRTVASGGPEEVATAFPEAREVVRGHGSGAGEPVVVTRGLVRRFGSQQAVADVDLDVRRGEVVGLLGANGAGKTTLIRMVLGLLMPSGGSVRLFGETPSRATRLRIGYLPQGLGLYDDLTVEENLAFVAAAYGVPTSGDLVPAHLSDSRGSLVGAVPLGVQRRTAFAAALLHHPELLVLDEPTSGVDPRARRRLWEEIRNAADAGAAVLVTTHHMEESASCDRLVVMSNGRVVATGSERDIVGSRRTVEVVAPGWTAAYEALGAAGLPVALSGRALRVPGSTIEGVREALGPVEAEVREVAASFEETFVALATAPARGEVA
jgi:ABC-type multidrug transport system ATPase subunit